MDVAGASDALHVAAAAGGAFAAGFIAALTGLGGGVVMVPLFTLVFGLPFNQAATLSLAAIVANATVSSTRYVVAGLVDSERAPYLALGAVLGGPLGASLALYVSEKWLAVVFAALLYYTSARLLAGRSDGGLGAERAASRARSLGLGGGAGVLAGLLGVGGGLVMVPFLVNFEGLRPKRAVATSSLITSISASSALARRFVVLQAGLWYAPIIAVAASLGSLAGSSLMIRLRGRVLAIVLALVLAAAATRLLVKTLGG